MSLLELKHRLTATKQRHQVPFLCFYPPVLLVPPPSYLPPPLFLYLLLLLLSPSSSSLTLGLCLSCFEAPLVVSGCPCPLRKQNGMSHATCPVLVLALRSVVAGVPCLFFARQAHQLFFPFSVCKLATPAIHHTFLFSCPLLLVVISSLFSRLHCL